MADITNISDPALPQDAAAGHTPVCLAVSDSLSAAKQRYQQQCDLTRIDCDPLTAGGWVCASQRIVNGTADALVASGQERRPAVRIAEVIDSDPCLSVGDSLSASRAAYAAQCRQPRVDCDPLSAGGWVCASIRIDNGTADQLVTRDKARVDVVSDRVADHPGPPPVSRPPEPVVNEAVTRQPPVVTAPRTGPASWSDSYAVGDQCYCDSAFDHGLAAQSIDTPQGIKSIRQVCADINAAYGTGGRGRVYYNTIQCGHGPVNNALDETQCPGVVDGDCQRRGPTWQLDRLYATVDDRAVTPGQWWMPTATQDLSWQLQLQGAINTAIDADVYFIDAEVPAQTVRQLQQGGAKVMCYISAGSTENWRSDASRFTASVIGNDYDGWPGERWIDTRQLELIGPIMADRIERCKQKGFDGIDADNVNGHVNNTGFALTREDTIAFVRWLANESHRQGMAFSLKNAQDIAVEVINHIDMLQLESCYRWQFCEDAKAVSLQHNKPVFMVEYQGIMNDFSAACETARQLNFSAIYRDLPLTPDGVYQTCR